MNSIVVPESHFSVKATKDVSAIMSPLEKHGIIHFCHLRCFSDGSMFVLVSNKDLYLHHLKHGYKIAPAISHDLITSHSKTHYHLAIAKLNDAYSHALEAYRNLFGLEHPIFFVERGKSYVDFFVYSSFVNNLGIINFYLNHMDVLEQFKFDYMEKAKKLILQSEDHKITLPEAMQLEVTHPNGPISLSSALGELQSENSGPYRILYQGKKIELTQPEMESLYLFKVGYTIKEVAMRLYRSPRTIEDRLYSIKQKFGLKNKSDLIRALFTLV